MKQTIYTVAILLLFSMNIWSQGTLTGTILDKSNGEALIGANVVVEGTATGTATDFDGKYQLKLEAGVYTITSSYIGYQDQKFENIEIKEGELTFLDITLSDETQDLDLDITISAKVIQRTETALLLMQKKSDKIQDGISSQEMRKLNVSDAAGAMTKVTGATVSGGKYIYIRGLGDRYSLSQLNGLIIPSTDPYRNSAQLDLIPSSLLESIVTAKTFTPDQPGIFTGGNVNIKTKSFPEQFTLTFGVSAGFNSQNNFNNKYLTYEGGSSDYWGYDDGGRAKPAFFNTPEAQEVFGLKEQLPLLARVNYEGRGEFLGTTADQIIKSANNQFAPTATSSGLDHGYSIAFGNQYKVGGKQLGVIFSAAFKQNYTHLDAFEKANWTLRDINSGELFNQGDFEETNSTESPNVNGMLGLAYKINKLNTITFNTIYNHNAEKSSRFITGERPDNIVHPDILESYTLSFKERELVNFQLGGTHAFKKLNNAQVDWKVSKANSSLSTPDLRFFENQYNVETERFAIPASNVRRPFHFYRDLEDEQYDYKLDITVPIASTGIKVKAGGLRTDKKRTFNESRYQVEAQSGYTESFEGDVVDYLSEDNIGLVGINESNGGYLLANYLVDRTTPANDYTGSDVVTAGYAMITAPITKNLKFVGGARIEKTELEVRSGLDSVGQIDQTDLLPSLNLIYGLSETMNLRASFSNTLARPNMREIAPFVSEDVSLNSFVFGNPLIEKTDVSNFDLRWEWFVKPGELFAVSSYYKKFENPIVLIYRNAPSVEIQYANVAGGDLFGVELEFRKDLGTFAPFLKNFKLNTNVSIIKSSLDVLDQTGLEPENRPFEGQPSFILNTALMYSNPEKELDVVLALNMVGDKLNIIGREGTPDIYDRGRTQLDFNLVKRFGPVSIKLSAKNLLNSAYVRSSEYEGQEYTYFRFKRGITYGLGVSYTMK